MKDSMFSMLKWTDDLNARAGRPTNEAEIYAEQRERERIEIAMNNFYEYKPDL